MPVIITIVVGVSMLVLGYLWAEYRRRAEGRRLRVLRQVVRLEVTAMQQMLRINQAYFRARDQLRAGRR